MWQRSWRKPRRFYRLRIRHCEPAVFVSDLSLTNTLLRECVAFVATPSTEWQSPCH
ncbi:MAG: hypothetical protein IJV35_09080 [Neisseriaceae bacterium]|nr:hypothetical protein [Neisseriaceae bacterium]